PRPEAGLRGGAVRDDGAHCSARALGDSPAHDHREEEHERDEEVDGDAGDHNLHPVAVATLAIRARLVLRVDLLEVAHPDDAHVAAEWERLHAVLGLAASERPQSRPEPEEE